MVVAVSLHVQQNKEDEGAGEQNTCCKWLVIYPQSPFQDMWNFLFLLAAIYIASTCDTHSVLSLSHCREGGESVACYVTPSHCFAAATARVPFFIAFTTQISNFFLVLDTLVRCAAC